MPEIDPPWRTDPLLNIINVKWSPPEHFLVLGTNSTFVGVTYGSKDGLEWVQCTVPASFSFVVPQGLAYGEGVWLIAGDESFSSNFKIYRSEDGAKTWAPAFTPSAFTNTMLPIVSGKIVVQEGDEEIKKLAFVVLLSSSSIAYSLDKGLTWTEKTFPDEEVFDITRQRLTEISYANGFFWIGTSGTQAADGLTVLGDPEAYFYRSNNLTSWTRVGPIFPNLPHEDRPTTPVLLAGHKSLKVAYDVAHEKYVAIGDVTSRAIPDPENNTFRDHLAIATSTNGLTWSGTLYDGVSQALTASGAPGWGSARGGLAYGNDRLVVGCAQFPPNTVVDGNPTFFSNTSAIKALVSTNGGGTWTRTLLDGVEGGGGITSAQVSGAAYSRSAKRFVLIGSIGPGPQGKVWHTDKDATQWTTESDLFSGAGSNAAYSVGLGKLSDDFFDDEEEE